MINRTYDCPIDDDSLIEFERAAIDAVKQSGDFALERFMGHMDVRSKSAIPGRDLVTDVDRESQRMIARVMAERFPDHQLLGEEDQSDNVEPAKDIVWAVDPIDGTANYVNGSITYAVSVGILYRGVPIAGAVWIPWASSDSNSTVIHGRLGGGATWGGEPIQVAIPSDDLGRPIAGRLSILPSNFRFAFRFSDKMRGHTGDYRVTGSASHEMVHVATGMYQYGIMGAAACWDFAAATIIVREAGGVVLEAHAENGWQEFKGWAQPYSNDQATYKKMRDWRGVVMATHPETAKFLAENLKPRRLSRLNRLTRRFRQMRRLNGHRHRG